MKRNIPLYIDIAFCVLLLPSMLFLLPIERWYQNNTLFVSLFIIWLYTVYFLFRHLVVPMLLQGGRRAVIGLCLLVAATVVTYFLTQYHITPSWPRPRHMEQMPQIPHPTSHGHFPRPRHVFRLSGMLQQAVWFLYVLVAAFGSAVALLTVLSRQILERQKVEFEKNRAELALYKAQINPHFLFNTLNTLYGLLLTDQEKAERAFMQFADMMKYMYQNTDREQIPLNTEIEYIEQYIELERNRMGEHTHVSFSHPSDMGEAQIAPMLLITFVENAFKFGVSSHDESEITISAEMKDGTLHFHTDNTIMRHGDGKGIGLENCRKRLELLYPGRHRLETRESDGRYIVNLEITL